MKQESFSISKRVHSFRYAFRGIATLLKDEHNSRIHVSIMTIVILAGFLFGITPQEWCSIIICFGLVLMAEAMNSAIEAIADLVMPDYHPLIKKAKDVAAAGVLISAIASVAVGLVVFLPYILKTLSTIS